MILGAHNIHKPERSQQVRGVARYHQHPGYDPNTYVNDIMLLKARPQPSLLVLPIGCFCPCCRQEWEGITGLEARSLPMGASVLTVCAHNLPPTPSFPQLTAKAALNDYVQTIPLPKGRSDLPTGTKCGVAGWGLIDEEQATNRLFETRVSIYSRRSCERFYPHLDTGMVCAGSFHELRDSSQVREWDRRGLLKQGRCWLPIEVIGCVDPMWMLAHHGPCG